MSVLLIRHARAGHRQRWDDDDTQRPLDERGILQAGALVDQLAGYPIDRILSSPYVRCVDSVVPLAEARGLEVEPVEELAEGNDYEAARQALIAAGPNVAASVHGDLVEALLGSSLKKGSTAVLELDGASLRIVEELPPPA